ncbi:MAG: DUF4870 domain-containing protein [bacterium]|nr:DUF4870 domain-containing protein [bacterium]
MNGMNGAESKHEPVATQEWERTYAVFTHLSLGAVMVIAVPVVVPLVMWLLKREKSAFVDDHGKEAVNFQISLVLYNLAGLVLLPICGVGAVVMVAAVVLGIVGAIMGAVAASNGVLFRYPACIRFVH